MGSTANSQGSTSSIVNLFFFPRLGISVAVKCSFVSTLCFFFVYKDCLVSFRGWFRCKVLPVNTFAYVLHHTAGAKLAPILARNIACLESPGCKHLKWDTGRAGCSLGSTPECFVISCWQGSPRCYRFLAK